MRHNISFGLKYRLTVNFLLMLIPVIILGFITQNITSTSFEKQAIASTTNTMGQTAKTIEHTVQSVYELYKQVVTDEQIRSYLKGSRDELSEYQQYALDKRIQNKLIGYTSSSLNISGITLITSNGVYISSMSDITRLRDTQMLMDSGWAIDAKESNGKFTLIGNHKELDDVRTTYRQEMAFSNYAMSSIGYSKVGGDVYFVFDYGRDVVRDILRGLDLGDNSEMHLISKDGRDIKSTSDSNYISANLDVKFQDEALLQDIFASSKDQDAYYIQYNGKKYLMIYHKVYNSSYVLMGLMPQEELMKPSRIIFLVTMLLLIFSGFVIIILGVVIFPKNIYSRVDHILVKMGGVKDGNLEIKECLQGDDEFAVIDRYFNAMVQQLNETIQDNYIKVLEKREAELNALQFQINPHFLYNTLGSINAMASVRGYDEIADMTEKLGDMFRYSINSSSSEFVSLREELEHIQNYIAIENVRFSHHIHMFIECPEQFLNSSVLKFILQPLVENAIKHGFTSGEDGFIDITVEKESDNELGDSLILRVTDDGKGMDQRTLENYNAYFKSEQQGLAHAHIGLKNVNARLKLAFGNRYGIELSSEHGTEVIIRLPYIPGSSEANKS